MSRKPPSPSVWSRWPARGVGPCAWACVLGTMLAFPFPFPFPFSVSAATLPEVEVSFVHEAPEFVFPMGEIEALAREETIRRLGKAFGFLRWLPSGQAAAPDAEWIVKLRQEQAGPGLIIWLEHHARVDGREFELPQNREQEVLYDLGSVIPSQSPSRLRDRVRKKIEEQLHEQFLDLVEVQLLRSIELADDVRAENPEHGVVVPLRLSDLKATRESLIGVRLKINDLHYGMFVIKAAGDVLEGDLAGCVRGQIQHFEVPPIDLQPPTWWHESLPEVMSKAQTKEVYMHEYDLDIGAGASTSDGIVTDPGD